MRSPGLKVGMWIALCSMTVSAALVFVPCACAQGNESLPAVAGRQWAPIAHNTATHEFILFGGWGSRTMDDTWVWRERWMQQTPTRHPEPRTQSAMAYDAERGEVVLFGGIDQVSHRTTSTSWAIVVKDPHTRYLDKGGNVLGNEVAYRDTWIWDGRDWTQRDPARMPPARWGHVMAYDAARKQIVLFGGIDDSDRRLLNDTWVWDGSIWEQKTPAHVPPARAQHTMGYDRVHRQVILFGGSGPNGSNQCVLNDTWVWDGRDWINADPPGDLPEARCWAGMDYDLGRERVILNGGTAFGATGQGTGVDGPWAWDGDRWIRLDPQEYACCTGITSEVSSEDAKRALVLAGGPGGPAILVRKVAPEAGHDK
jgi:hypothetical protein